MRAVLEPSFNEDGEVIETDDGIDLRLILKVDIYSPRNLSLQPDNTRLAALNGPLLVSRSQREWGTFWRAWTV